MKQPHYETCNDPNCPHCNYRPNVDEDPFEGDFKALSNIEAYYSYSDTIDRKCSCGGTVYEHAPSCPELKS